MRLILSIFLLLLLLPITGFSKADELYNQSIIVAPLKEENLNRSIVDLKFYLEKATKVPFSVGANTERTDNGIYLLLNRPDLLPARLNASLTKGGIEDYVLFGDQKRLLIVATHPLGLSRGIYGYLDHLGFRWYLPGNDWTIVPSLSSITYTGSMIVSPHFSFRDFFGTGGLAEIKAFDPTLQLAGTWNDWKRRNRFGGEYSLAGHYGETFNIKYKKELEQHPEYLAKVNGKREWSVSAKWCISNKNLRALFIADRVAELQRRLQQSSYANEKIVLSVDPADGGGECEDRECAKMGTANDRIYFLANEVTKALKKVSSRAYANIYAYNTHPAPPPFKLDEHLIVQMVPYAFQEFGTPEEMILAWKKAHSNLHMYDYYGLTDWHWDIPLSGPTWGLDAYLKRVKNWKNAGIKGYMLESSYAAASTGLGLYLLGRWGWNAAENTDIVQEKFYQQLFGKAAGYAKTYFQKIAQSYSGSADLPYLLDLLDKASKSTSDNDVKNRIDFLKSYLHYLVLVHRYQQVGDEQRMDELFTYVYQLYFSGAVHSTRIATLLNSRLPGTSNLRTAWQFDQPGSKAITIKPLTKKQLDELLAQDRKKYPLLPDFPYTQKRNATGYTLSEMKTSQLPTQEGMLILDWPETVVQTASDGTVRFYMKVNEGSENNTYQKFAVRLVDTATGREVAAKTIEIDKNWQLISLTAQRGKTYQLVAENKGWIRFVAPENQWLAFRSIPTYAVLGKLRFYADSQNSFLYFNNNAKENPVFFDTNGKKAEIEKVSDLNLYRLKLGKAKGVWWTIAETEYKFLKFPDKNLLFFPHNNITVMDRGLSFN
jgi:hypothetical protein